MNRKTANLYIYIYILYQLRQTFICSIYSSINLSIHLSIYLSASVSQVTCLCFLRAVGSIPTLSNSGEINFLGMHKLIEYAALR